MVHTIPTTGMHCFKKSVNFKTVLKKHNNYLISKKLFTLPVDTLEEKTLGQGQKPG